MSEVADELERLYDRFRNGCDDDRPVAWEDFSDACEARLPEILAALRASPSPLAAEGKSEGEPSELVDRGGAR